MKYIYNCSRCILFFQYPQAAMPHFLDTLSNVKDAQNVEQ